MCIISVSLAGRRQPTKQEITNMFVNNPDGAGYMWAENGKVRVRKGFMTLDELLADLDERAFTEADSVIYHFRVSTQAGVNPAMTHPFPVYHDIRATKLLAYKAPLAFVHNGIIRLTSNGNKEYSDTALFSAEYLSLILRKPSDIHDQSKLQLIAKLGKSKFAFMDGDGAVEMIGEFTEEDGIFFSNSSYKKRNYYISSWNKPNYRDPDFWNSREFTDYLLPQK